MTTSSATEPRSAPGSASPAASTSAPTPTSARAPAFVSGSSSVRARSSGWARSCWRRSAGGDLGREPRPLHPVGAAAHPDRSGRVRIIVYPHDLAVGGSQINAIDLAPQSAIWARRVRLRHSGPARRTHRRSRPAVHRRTGDAVPAGPATNRASAGHVAPRAHRRDPRLRVAPVPRRLFRRPPDRSRRAHVHGPVDGRVAPRAPVGPAADGDRGSCRQCTARRSSVGVRPGATDRRGRGSPRDRRLGRAGIARSRCGRAARRDGLASWRSTWNSTRSTGHRRGGSDRGPPARPAVESAAERPSDICGREPPMWTPRAAARSSTSRGNSSIPAPLTRRPTWSSAWGAPPSGRWRSDARSSSRANTGSRWRANRPRSTRSSVRDSGASVTTVRSTPSSPTSTVSSTIPHCTRTRRIRSSIGRRSLRPAPRRTAARGALCRPRRATRRRAARWTWRPRPAGQPPPNCVSTTPGVNDCWRVNES